MGTRNRPEDLAGPPAKGRAYAMGLFRAALAAGFPVKIAYIIRRIVLRKSNQRCFLGLLSRNETSYFLGEAEIL